MLTRAQGRIAGVLVLVALLAAGLGTGHESVVWSGRVFDIYQRLHPRIAREYPVIIVEIDERSLRRYGQWPWPRSRIATLLDRIAADGALAVGFDILFTEPDHASPKAVIESYAGLDPELVAHLARLPDTDAVLAAAIARAPLVTARALVNGVEADAWKGEAIAAAPVNVPGVGVALLPRADALIHALPVLERNARGFGVLTAAFDPDGVVRRMPLAWSVGGTVAPGMSVEMLRVALGANWSTLRTSARGIDAVEIGATRFATATDGSVRPWFAESVEKRYLSAVAVLESEVPKGYFNGHLVLIGVTGLGTQDRVRSPLGMINGTEVHAQTIENLVAGTLLTRPAWGYAAELAVSALIALALIALMPRLSPLSAALLGAACILALLLASYGAFHYARLLIDPSQPALLVGAIFVVMLGVMLTEYDRIRRELAESLEETRLRAARISGELRAAGEIQMALLPDPRTLKLPPSLRAHALLEPARDIGGDLYDMVLIDAHRLFFVVGDVSGKGVKASLFMAISKALLKSAIMRTVKTPNVAMETANAEISRENPAALFVTAFMGVIDADTGVVEFCNAGHENPLIFSADGSCRTLSNEGGPPLCVMEDFPYPLERFALAPGETLLIITDGATEARSPDGALLGHEALRRELGSGGVAISDPEKFAEAVRTIVRRHEAGRRPTDDLTVAAIHYVGNA